MRQKKEVAEKAKVGIVLSLEESLYIYQDCMTDETTPSYKERCGDRPGGAYDNCTN